MSRMTSMNGSRGRRRSLGAAALLVAAAVALTGCQSAVNTPPPAHSSAPKAGGTLTVATELDAQSAGVWRTLARNYPWIENVFQTIIHTDPKTGKQLPVLATKWKMADDNQSIDITIRDGVTFHTGRKMTADDVKWTFETSTDPKAGSNLAFGAKQFKSIDVVSPTELKITFSKPINESSLMDYFDQTLILDKETYAGIADGSKVVGTGPYTWADWKPNASYTLKKYDKYWGDKGPYLDEIDYVVTADPTAELSALKSGRAQVAFGLTSNDAATFKGNNSYSLLALGGTVYPIGMDVTAAPFDKKEVRQAVAYAIDASRINEQVFAGTGTVSELVWGPKEPGYSEDLANTYKFNIDKAKQMIKDAGATGAKVPIAVGANPAPKSEYEIVANTLKSIGLVPSIVQLDQPGFNAGQSNGDLGPAFLSLHGQVGLSPATMLDANPVLRKGNPSKFWTPEYEQLRAAVQSATSDQEAASALDALSKYMIDQAFVINIVQAPGMLVVSNKVQGVDGGKRGFIYFDKTYLAE